MQGVEQRLRLFDVTVVSAEQDYELCALWKLREVSSCTRLDDVSRVSIDECRRNYFATCLAYAALHLPEATSYERCDTELPLGGSHQGVNAPVGWHDFESLQHSL